MPELQPVPIVIGTAGHIDHGKSALVEALCGTHPDRWQEERERGITMDLGYAQMAEEDGLEIGFVDVPGHEKLVRKMVAGATGMGAAILVIACDDGVMLQTREHFEVLNLLGVHRGLVALTKTDLVDEETRMLVAEEVSELVAGTPWESAPVLEVSAHQGDGMPELRKAVRELALEAQAAADHRLAFRLPVQRAFAIEGAGTIATGVCAGGQLEAGQEVVALPSQQASRVRRVQVHGRAAETALPGLRTALNLPELEPEQCPRGTVLVAPEAVHLGQRARFQVELLPGAPALEHGAEVQLLADTSAVEGRLFLVEDDEQQLLFADIELEEPISLVFGQRGLLRRPSPARNLGVVRFLGFAPFRIRRRDQEERNRWVRAIECLEDPEELLVWQCEGDHGRPRTKEELAPVLGWKLSAVQEVIDRLVQEDRLHKLGARHVVAAGSAQELIEEVQGVIANFRSKNAGRLRIPLQRFRDRLGKDGWKVVERMPEAMFTLMGLKPRRGDEWEMLGVDVDAELQQQAAALLEALTKGGMAPGEFQDIVASSGMDAATCAQAKGYLVDSGQAVEPEEGLVFAAALVEDLRQQVVTQLQGDGMDIPALRDRYQTTRKYMMPLLEYLDQCGVTERRGPNRLLRDATAAIV